MRGFHLSRAMALWLPSKPSQAQPAKHSQWACKSMSIGLMIFHVQSIKSSVAPYQNFLFICSLFLVWLWPSDTPSAWTKSTRMMRVSNPECFCLKCCDETFDASSTRVELLLCDVMIPARALGCIISIHIDRLQNISNARLEAKNTLSASLYCLYNPKKYHWQILLIALNVWLTHCIKNAEAQPRCNSSKACCHKSGRKSQTCRPTKPYKTSEQAGRHMRAYAWPFQAEWALKQISMTKMKENTSENQHASGISSVPDWQLQLVQRWQGTRSQMVHGNDPSE